LISLKHNFLFVHIPKTAGNSIQNVLIAYSEDKIVRLAPFQDGVERFEIRSGQFDIHKHSTLQEYRTELGSNLFKRLFKFSCARNPWERAISFYFSPHRGRVFWNRMHFKNLVSQIPPLAAYTFLKEGGNAVSCFDNMDFFIRYENLDDDFKKACDLIGIPWVPLLTRNKSVRQPCSAYYDNELKELVRNKFSEEIAYFGYEFEKNA
jgi:Sulfotransferase family